MVGMMEMGAAVVVRIETGKGEGIATGSVTAIGDATVTGIAMVTGEAAVTGDATVIGVAGITAAATGGIAIIIARRISG
jgi:hypothetical protein